MAFKLHVSAAKEAGTVHVYLYGIISRWADEIAPSKVAAQIQALEKDYTKCIIHINSNGGEVAEGIALHKILTDTSMELEIVVDGIAASMAAVLLQVPNAKRIMGKYSKMMLHSPSGYASGNSDDLRQYAQQMDDFETTLVEIITDRCGLEAKDVKTKWFDKKDHWLTPQQALKEKLIDEIVDGVVEKAPRDLTDPVMIYNFYEQQISNSNKTDMDLKAILAKLGLAANSTEDQALDFMGNLVNENTNLKTQITNLTNEVNGLKAEAANLRTQQITDMISDAVTAKKITEAQRATYQALAEKDFENTKAILDAIAPYKPLTNVTASGDDSPIAEDRKSWTFTDWQKKDGKGLLALKADHPEEYKALYKKSFGVEPKN